MEVKEILLPMLLCILLFGVLSVRAESANGWEKEDFISKKIAIWTGTVFDLIFKENIGDTNLVYYNMSIEVMEALRNRSWLSVTSLLCGN